MHRHQLGFTLIELITVVIILGILAAIALPKFINIQNEAVDSAVQGVAGAVTSASTINYSAFTANSGKPGLQRLNAANVCTVTLLGPLLQGGSTTQLVPNSPQVSYAFAGAPTGNCSGANAAGTAVSCVINATKAGNVRSATATVICTG